jgi:hypothetical protein
MRSQRAVDRDAAITVLERNDHITPQGAIRERAGEEDERRPSAGRPPGQGPEPGFQSLGFHEYLLSLSVLGGRPETRVFAQQDSGAPGGQAALARMPFAAPLGHPPAGFCGDRRQAGLVVRPIGPSVRVIGGELELNAVDELLAAASDGLACLVLEGGAGDR